MSEAAPETRRVVLLGASNLTLSFATVMACLREQSDAPLDVLVAHGHGRSFGLPSRVLGRWLPPIADCGLWRRLAEVRDTRTIACVTDIGNDVMYGASVDEIAGWVERDLDRLADARAEVVLTRVPLSSITQLSPTRFHILRAIYFPTRRVAWPSLLNELRRLDDRIAELARARNLRAFEPQASWYGWDPIHILRGKRLTAWRTILDSSRVTDASAATTLSSGERRALARLRPEHRRLFSIEQKYLQPTVRWPDGTTISAY